MKKPKGRASNVLAAERLVRIKAYIAKGMTIREIAQADSTSNKAVSAFCARFKLKPRRSCYGPQMIAGVLIAPSARRLDITEVRGLIDQGLTNAAIARGLGFKSDSVGDFIARHQLRDPEPLAERDVEIEVDDIPDDVPAAPNRRFIASLSNSLGRERAVEQARLEARKAKLKSERTKGVAAPLVARRFPVKGFSLGQSVHAQQHGDSTT